MKKILLFLALLGLALPIAPTRADDADTAVKMVQKAVEYYKANGLEKAMDEVNNPKGQFVDGAFYVWLFDLDGVVIAHPVNSKLVGQNAMGFKDVDGKLFVKELMDLSKTTESGWVDYKYKNPKTNEVEPKSTYFRKSGDIVLCCGIYKK